MTNLLVSIADVNAAREDTPFDLANHYLYQLCAEHPGHQREDEITAKLVLIGRTYAASIERRKREDGDALTGDEFLYKKAIPAIQKSEKQIDNWIAEVKRNPTPEACIRAHALLTGLFAEISGMRNRSLASKYLHFHCPDYFYIYDSRAWSAIKRMFPGKWLLPEPAKTGDVEYAKFYRMCCAVVDAVKKTYGISLNPRHLDNLLLKNATVLLLQKAGAP